MFLTGWMHDSVWGRCTNPQLLMCSALRNPAEAEAYSSTAPTWPLVFVVACCSLMFFNCWDRVMHFELLLDPIFQPVNPHFKMQYALSQMPHLCTDTVWAEFQKAVVPKNISCFTLFQLARCCWILLLFFSLTATYSFSTVYLKRSVFPQCNTMWLFCFSEWKKLKKKTSLKHLKLLNK